jgi:uncharacterized membrane protein
MGVSTPWKSRLGQPVDRNVQAVVDLERKALDERTHTNRFSEIATKMASSGAFIVVHVLIFAGWLIVNTTRFAFDRNPFNLLNLILAFEAIVLTSIVLNAQTELRRISERRAHLDLQVNILAEQELTAILGLVNQLCDRLGVDKKSNPTMEQLSKDTDVRSIATAIEKKLEETPKD